MFDVRLIVSSLSRHVSLSVQDEHSLASVSILSRQNVDAFPVYWAAPYRCHFRLQRHYSVTPFINSYHLCSVTSFYQQVSSMFRDFHFRSKYYPCSMISFSQQVSSMFCDFIFAASTIHILWFNFSTKSSEDVLKTRCLFCIEALRWQHIQANKIRSKWFLEFLT